MKILLVNKFLYPRGGAETYLLKLGEELQRRGHLVEYFGMYDSKNIVGNAQELLTTELDFHGKGADRLLYPFKIIYSFEARRKIKQVISAFKPDVIHFNNINFQLTPSVIDAGAKLKIPMVQTVHDLQMLCPNHLMLDFKRKIPCELCLEASHKWNCIKKKCIHNSRIKSIIGAFEGAFYDKYPAYDKIGCYICPSHFMENKLRRIERYRKKTIVIPNFLGTVSQRQNQKKENYILYFGRFSEEKGIDKVLETARMLPDIPFVIAGSGPMEKLCTQTNLNNVKFAGFLVGEKLQALIEKAVFTVHFSTCYENSPLAVLESQALGTPVVCNSIGGIPELVENGKTGLLLENYEPGKNREEIEKLYYDKERVMEMSNNCLEKRKDMMTLEKYCDLLLDTYLKVIRKQKG